MLLKLFKFVFRKLIADLPEEDRNRAKVAFLEILAVISRNNARGFSEGLR